MLDALTVFFGALGFFARALVLWLLWGWFGEPLTGLALTYWSAAGVLLILSALRGPRLRTADRIKERIREGREETTDEKLVDLVWVLAHLVILYPLTTAIGWLLYRIGGTA